MQWVKNNVVGLIGLIFVMGSATLTLYVRTEVNGGAIKQLKDTMEVMSSTQNTQNVALQGYVVRTVQVEGQIERFTESNRRLVEALDKLDALYGTILVRSAVQDERIEQVKSTVRTLGLHGKLEKL